MELFRIGGKSPDTNYLSWATTWTVGTTPLKQSLYSLPSRSDFGNASQSFVATMNLVKLPKSTDFMTSVCANMETLTFGNTLLIYLTTCHSQHSLMDRFSAFMVV